MFLAKDVIPEIFGNFDDSSSFRGVELHASSLRVSHGGFQNFAIGHERLEGSRSRTWFGTS